MPQTPHVEKHFTGSQTIRDLVIGMSDGLTAPFALAAGLSGAVANSHIVVAAGLAEIAAGVRSPWVWAARRPRAMPSTMPASGRAKNGRLSPSPRRRPEKSWRSSRPMASRLRRARP